MQIIVRDAEPADVPLVLEMLHALARFTEHEHWLQVSAETIARDGFGEAPAFHSVLAVRADGAAVGLATWYAVYSTFGAARLLYIEDLFVDEACRGQGIGRRLLAHLAAAARARDFGGLALSVLHWNPARAVYERYGFRETEGWLPYRLTGEGFEALARRATQTPR